MLTSAFHSKHFFALARRRRTQYVNPPSTPRKFIESPEDYQGALKELSDEGELETVDSASDIDESELIEHFDHETSSEIDTDVLGPPQASS
ncbi:hypothetical protein AVEN_22857-1 [Araneus ventricosus]|uniref:Uncharacterized protein n=1 Tax=Araneus ventricosus TaxID=182803 RepID=A0A4Y2QU65_ARAVE|nr:hypothetical protein AVEN_22857-1 [Araneus ventricosus]